MKDMEKWATIRGDRALRVAVIARLPVVTEPRNPFRGPHVTATELLAVLTQAGETYSLDLYRSRQLRVGALIQVLKDLRDPHKGDARVAQSRTMRDSGEADVWYRQW